MWTGRETLHSIEQGLNQVREQVQQVDERIQSTSRDLVALRQDEGARYRRLAQIRLDQMVSGEIAAGLDAADRRVSELLAEREAALQSLQQRIDAARKTQSDLEQRRAEQSDRVERAAEALDVSEGEVQKQLHGDPEYQRQLETARKADSVARHAEEKTHQAESDRAEKGKPYESDPLFIYLWKRGYGTTKYSGNRLTRFLDKWVANLCNYQDARPNYAMLLDIPVRLREHAARARAAADREFEALKSLEREAAEQGGVFKMRQALDEAEERMAAIDRNIHDREEEIRGFLKERATYAAGEDAFFRRCIEALAGAFQREKLSVLHGYARATATAADDVIVHELADLNERETDLEETLAEHKKMYERQLARLQELEDVRRRFKHERFDDIHSVFGNADLLAVVLSQFLRGMASSDDLWRTIRRAQRYRRMRSNPRFGSGGFGDNGTWRIPFPKGRWGPIGRGGGGFGSGGGFRTGGGF